MESSDQLPKKRLMKAMQKPSMRPMMGQIKELLEQNSGKVTPYELVRLAKYLKKKAYSDVDIGYIRTVLFPERYSYDIPAPLTNLSYCRFTDKQEAIITTGTDGSTTATGAGMILWFPKTNMGPSLFFLPQTSSATSLPYNAPIPLNGGSLNQTRWRCGMTKSYPSYFTQTSLVAASISIQYIGQLEVESGMMCGGHIYGQSISEIVIDDIENAQSMAMGRPSDGLRFVYLPKDNKDYEYYPCKLDVAHNDGANQGQNEATWSLQLTTVSNQPSTCMGLDGAAMPIEGTTGAATISYQANTPCIAIYWRGLAGGYAWLRIDTTRKFNGIPRAAYRDIVEVSRSKRNFDQKKTTDIVRNLGMSIPVAGHTMKSLDRVSDQIQNALPNIGALHETGGLKDINSLQGLATALGGMGQSERIYDYD